MRSKWPRCVSGLRYAYYITVSGTAAITDNGSQSAHSRPLAANESAALKAV